MDLWIRTQDRMRLVKPNRLAIKGESKLVGLGDWYIIESQNSLRYATYSTKERALEVLDEIQDMLESVVTADKVKKEEIVGANMVYEMPEY